MVLHERLVDFAMCPHDDEKLALADHAMVCTRCHRLYEVADGVAHFITDEHDRPSNPAGLGRDYAQNSPERLSVRYYHAKYDEKQAQYDSNPNMRTAVDLAADVTGIVVDLATGHGGGFTPWLATRLSDDVLLLASDACPPVIENWTKFLTGIRSVFGFIDVDLEKRLPFVDGSIDQFTGVAILNVRLDQPGLLMSEIAICLRTGGRLVVTEMLFSERSRTTTWLREQGNPYASVSDYRRFLAGFGMEMTQTIEVKNEVGKIDPRDGLPIDDSDEWAEVAVVARRMTT